MAQDPAKRGRPSLYTDEIAAEICERIGNGEPLAKICREDRMPGYQTVFDWMKAKPDFSVAIARARRDGHDAIASNTMAVARGEPGFSSGDVARDKLIIDTDLKLLAKWDPRYAERMALTGADGGALQIENKTIDSSRLTQEQRDQLRAILEAAMAPRVADGTGDAIEGEFTARGDGGPAKR